MHPARVAAAVLPALALAATGLLHPAHVGDDPARWTAVHVAGLVLFPLLGLAPWIVARTAGPVFSIAAAVLGYLYAVGYTALDVVAGITNGALVLQGTRIGPLLYPIADALGLPAAVCHLLATAVAVVAAARLRSRLAVPGAVLVLVAAVSFLTSHIYPWRGVATMVLLAAGWALLVLAARRTGVPSSVARPRGSS